MPRAAGHAPPAADGPPGARTRYENALFSMALKSRAPALGDAALGGDAARRGILRLRLPSLCTASEPARTGGAA